MVSLTMPYVIPLFLGMTFDARNSKPGVDIYDMEYVDNPTITEYQETKSTYKVTTNMRDIQDELKIDGDLSLKLKTGMIDIEGKGAFLKNQRDLKNTIIVLSSLTYTSKVKSFGSKAKPRDGWEKAYNPRVLGTHVVTSVTYGAEMVASARFVVYNSSQTQEVRGEVEAALGTGGSGNELVAEGKLENLQKKVQGKANLEISFYGTVPLRSIPNSVEGLRTLISTFGDQVKETGLQEGIPMSVELTPLTDICDPDDQDKFKFLKNKSLMNELGDFEENFDELRQARLDLAMWARNLPYDTDDKFQNEIGQLLKNISLVLQVYYEVSWEMDLEKGPEQLKPAFDAYNYDGKDVYRRYDRLVRRLINKINKEVKRDKVATDTYVQWGNDNCTASGTVVLHKGFAVSSSEEGIGGAAQYSCYPKDSKPGYSIEASKVLSLLAGIKYTALDKDSNPFKGPNAKKVPEQGVPCAKCHSPESAAVAMFSAVEKCPLTWEVMYTGYLMSARSQEGFTTEYICVDENPSEPYQMQKQTSQMNTLALTVVQTGGSLPKDLYIEGALIRCVVCSMKSNQVTF